MTLPSGCGCYEDTGGFHPCAQHSGARVISAPTTITPTITPTITVTPAAVGRGEREVKGTVRVARQVLLDASLLIEDCLAQHPEDDEHGNAWAARTFAALRESLAALPPDAGGEDGERDKYDRVIEDDEVVTEGRFHMERMSDGHIWFQVRDAAFDLVATRKGKLEWRPQQGWHRVERDALRARRSATERSGGGN